MKENHTEADIGLLVSHASSRDKVEVNTDPVSSSTANLCNLSFKTDVRDKKK